MVARRGRQWDEDQVAQVMPAADKTITQDDVLQVLGSPSFESSFGPKSWFYVRRETSRRAFLKPKTRELGILEVAFSDKGEVTGVSERDMETLKPVSYFSKVTPSRGYSETFFEQIFGNFGRLNKKGSKN